MEADSKEEEKSIERKKKNEKRSKLKKKRKRESGNELPHRGERMAQTIGGIIRKGDKGKDKDGGGPAGKPGILKVWGGKMKRRQGGLDGCALKRTTETKVGGCRNRKTRGAGG